MPGVTWWKLTNSIMVRRAGRKPTFARPAASVSLGSEPTFAARYMNDCIGGELSNAFERPLRAAPPVPAFGLHPS